MQAAVFSFHFLLILRDFFFCRENTKNNSEKLRVVLTNADVSAKSQRSQVVALYKAVQFRKKNSLKYIISLQVTTRTWLDEKLQYNASINWLWNFFMPGQVTEKVEKPCYSTPLGCIVLAKVWTQTHSLAQERSMNIEKKNKNYTGDSQYKFTANHFFFSCWVRRGVGLLTRWLMSWTEEWVIQVYLILSIV